MTRVPAPTAFLLACVFLIGCPEPSGVTSAPQTLPPGFVCETGANCLTGVCAEGICSGFDAIEPVAIVGDNRVTFVGIPVALDGTASTDPNGAPLSYRWELSGKPAASSVSVDDPSADTISITPDKGGVYVVDLIVSNATYESAPTRVLIIALSPDGTLELVANGADCVSNAECVSQTCTNGLCTGNLPPVADAGVSQQIRTGQTVQLDGGGSNDPEGQPLSFAWALVISPSGSAAFLDDAAIVAPSFTPDVPGLYIVDLVVNDGAIGSSQATTAILANDGPLKRLDGHDCSQDSECISDYCFSGVCTTNQAPIADAGLAQLLSLGQSLTLDGSASADPEGASLTYAWSIASSPSASSAALTEMTSTTPSFLPDVAGLYTFELRVNDGRLPSLPASVTIAVQADGETSNAPPVAVAGNFVSATVGAPVVLDGTASYDPEGGAITYLWQLQAPSGSGALLNDPALPQPTFTPDQAGSYTASLVVNDGAVSSPADAVVIVAEGVETGEPCASNADCQSDYCAPTGLCAIDLPPTADAGDEQEVLTGTTVSLDGSASSDPEGSSLNFNWSLLVTPMGSNAVLSDAATSSPALATDENGTYVVRLEVDAASQSSEPAFVVIRASNALPLAKAGPDQVVEVGQVVTLDGSASNDPDGQPVTYFWVDLAGPAGSTATLTPDVFKATFTPDVAGEFVATLVVNDGFQSSLPDTVTITAGLLPQGAACSDNTQCTSGFCSGTGQCASNSPPVADAGSATTTFQSVAVTLDATASNDPDGDGLTYLWTLLTAPAGSNAIVTDADQAVASLTPDVLGVYTLKLAVDDGYGTPSEAFTTITFKDPCLDTLFVTCDAFDVGYLKASNPGASDAFGYSVAIDGDTLAVGAYLESSNATTINGPGDNDAATASGAVYVFVRVGATWQQQAYIKPSNAGAGDRFGESLDLDGDTLVVGAPREASNATVVDGDGTDDSVGDAGAAYVFQRTGTVWAQQGYLKAPNTGLDDQFGYAVAVSGDTVAVGARFEDSDGTTQANNTAQQSGAVYTFDRTGESWSADAYLKASNVGVGDQFGFSLALDGDTLVIGAATESGGGTGLTADPSDDSAAQAGAVYVFSRAGGTWSEVAYVKPSNTGAGDQFGYAVAIDGDVMVVGARFEDSNAVDVDGLETGAADDSGAAYVFIRNSGIWSQHAYLKASNTGPGDWFGRSVAISAGVVAVGAFGEASDGTNLLADAADDTAAAAGAVYLFVRNGDLWSTRGYLKASNTQLDDYFGWSVGLSNDLLAVGATREDGASSGLDGDETSDGAVDSGAVYLRKVVP